MTGWAKDEYFDVRVTSHLSLEGDKEQFGKKKKGKEEEKAKAEIRPDLR